MPKKHKLTLDKTQSGEPNYLGSLHQLPDKIKKCIIPSSRNLSVTKKSRVSACRKYRHKDICIDTQLTTFYCYSATSSIANLSNK